MTLDDKVRGLETRMAEQERLGHMLKDELGGLRDTIHGLIASARSAIESLDGHHKAYAAAAQRAELAEAKAARALDALTKLEREAAALRASSGDVA